MRAGNVILLRHGQTDYNAQRKLQGQVDIPLNATGLAQAREAAQALALIKPAAIISSDLSRAAATADAVAQAAGMEVIMDERIRERSFGDWEGLTAEEIESGWPDEFIKWRNGEHPEGVNAELRMDLGIRFAEAVNEWSSKFEISDTLVFVTHGAAISTGVTALLGQNPEEWRGIAGLENCRWSRLSSIEVSPGWRLTDHNVRA